MITLDLRFAEGFLDAREWGMMQPFVTEVHQRLLDKDVPGGEFLGWLHLPTRTLATGIGDILEAAQEIRETADALVVIGIGGSYLGARAAFEWCRPEHWNQLSAAQRQAPELYFAGNHLSAAYLSSLLQVLEGKRVALNVVSKSGTTTEPAVAFRILRDWLIRQVGPAEARKRIYATTDHAGGRCARWRTAKAIGHS